MTRTVQARCERVVSEAGDIKVFTLRVDDADAEFLKAIQPGKHIAIEYPDVSGLQQQRLYSITRKRCPDAFEIAVKRSGCGSVSDNLHLRLQEGSIISLKSVAGDISISSIIEYECIGMLAGGIGITLPVALLRELQERSQSGQRVPIVKLFFCVPRISDIPFLHELLELDLTTSWFTFRVFVTREKIQPSDHFLPGRPTADYLKTLGHPQAVVICGSHSFAQALRTMTGATLPATKMLIESFTPPAAPIQPKIQDEESSHSLKLLISGSGEIIEALPGKSLLDILESNGTSVRSQCRVGICGTCRIKVTNGDCRFEPDFCLSGKEKHNGYALACCTFPLAGDVIIDLRPTA